MAVATDQSLGFEQLEQSGSALRQPSEDGVDVDVDGDELDLGPRRVEVDRAPEDDHHAEVENDPLPGESGRDRRPRGSPALHLEHLGVCSRVASGSTRSM